MKVPFLDLKAHHDPIKAEILASISQVIDANAFAGGPYVAKFEQEFAAFCGANHAVAVGNGTDAIWFALLALGVGPGDEVITVPHTFIATAEAITFCGAKPVFIDIDERTYTMDPQFLQRAITPKTKAIIPVHIFGQTADLDPILSIAATHGIPVVEDACQAHGAEYKGRKAGTLGAAGAFSFYPGKNLGAFGEGGGTITNDADLAQKMRVLRDHGQARKYYHDVVGWNGRMDGIQGAVLSVKLRRLADSNARRREIAKQYDRLLAGLPGVIVPRVADYATHIYHIYAVRVQNRDKILADLGQAGISCGIHYPVPLHLQAAYRSLGYSKGSFPVAERCAAEFLSLPMFPEMTTAQVEAVVETLRKLI
jgi:dTDP-4-amino-4,6-dideoxygalactose transaminase